MMEEARRANDSTGTIRFYKLKCKRCGRIFDSSIAISDRGADLDKLARIHNREKCTACRKTANYRMKEYILG